MAINLLDDTPGTLQTRNGPRLPEYASSQRYVVNTRSHFFIPSGHNNTSAQRVFVLVTKLLKNASSVMNGWCTLVCLSEDLQIIMNQIGDGLVVFST
jgi:hypothetical protein